MQHLINYIGNLLEWYIACRFFSALHPRKFSQKTSLLLGALITLVQFAGNTFFLGRSALTSIGLLFLFAYVFTFLLSTLYVSKWYWKLLESAVLFILNGVVETAYGLLMQIVLRADHEAVQSNLLYYFIGTVTCKMITLFLVCFIRLRNLRKTAAAPKSVIVPMLLFPLGTTLVSVIAVSTAFRMQTLSFAVITVAGMVVLIAANMVLMRVIEQQGDYIRTKEELRYAKAHIDAQVEHYDALYQYQTETRRMRHDERNKLLALSGLLRSGDTDKALTMLDKELALIETAAERVVDTGNPVLDAVLQSKLDEARRQDVTLRIRAQTDEGVHIDNIKLGVLLGAAVDNAVEAAANVTDPDVERAVDITLQTRQGRVLVSVENPTVEECGNVNALRSDKDDPLHHGFGLGSIRSIIDDHDGTLCLTWQDHVFRLEAGLANKNIHNLLLAR